MLCNAATGYQAASTDMWMPQSAKAVLPVPCCSASTHVPALTAGLPPNPLKYMQPFGMLPVSLHSCPFLTL